MAFCWSPGTSSFSILGIMTSWFLSLLTFILKSRAARGRRYLLCVVGEVDFVEDLGAVLLDGVYLHLALQAVGGEGLSAARLQEALSVPEKRLAGRKQAAAEPQQLPALLHAGPGFLRRGCLIGSLEFTHSLSGAAFLDITWRFTSFAGCLWDQGVPGQCCSSELSLLEQRVTAYLDLSLSPLWNIVTSSAMSSAVPPPRVKSPFRVSRLTAWPDALPSLRVRS
ncbi:hypothetical protein EYF80_015603 [Liparis tanakae]|uniref:Uncharacterized protein n=1 Tax=Liparis tanakae TaxID=230148 RepID=A0A4Z2I887_9TELE|nr:hypothetical protein EYF80_015603 [Liparis tanakae]